MTEARLIPVAEQSVHSSLGFKKLGVEAEDPIVARFSNIATIFGQLKLPLSELSTERVKKLYASSRRVGPETIQLIDDPNDPPDFRPGVDFFLGRYHGEPRSVNENTAAAEYQGRRGVEIWRILKSVALVNPDGSLVFVHVRGDRQVETTLPNASEEQLAALGLEYGTVNPFVITDSVKHVFDRDLVAGDDYPGDDIVLTSSGDPRFFVGFNIRRYIAAVSGFPASHMLATSVISNPESGQQRIIARHPITIIGGDSGIDTAHFGETILSTITRKLEEAEQYFGDRSLPRVRLLSDPGIASSIDTPLYREALRAHVEGMIDELRKSCSKEAKRKEIVTCSSTAMHGAVGDMLRAVEEFQYIGPQEAIEHILQGLAERGVGIAHTVLVGLPSVYDQENSAFAGKILDNALPVNNNVMQQIKKFIDEQKVGKADAKKTKLYGIIGSILRSHAAATSSSFEDLKGQNILVVLGASELDSYINAEHERPDTLEIVRSVNPDTIKAALTKARDDTMRFIFISPIQAITERSAQISLGLAA